MTPGGSVNAEMLKLHSQSLVAVAGGEHSGAGGVEAKPVRARRNAVEKGVRTAPIAPILLFAAERTKRKLRQERHVYS